MTSAKSSSPRHSNCSSVTCTREDKAKHYDGLAEEVEPVLPETKAMEGAVGFRSLAWIWASSSEDLSFEKSSSTVRVSRVADSWMAFTFTSHTLRSRA